VRGEKGYAPPAIGARTTYHSERRESGEKKMGGVAAGKCVERGKEGKLISCSKLCKRPKKVKRKKGRHLSAVVNNSHSAEEGY